MSDNASCDSCSNYVYDEEDECYYCELDLDEDEMYHLITGKYKSCPYYQLDNEYQIVKHQM